MRRFMIIFVILLSTQLSASERRVSSPLKDVSFGLGNFSEFIGRVQTDDQGSHNSLEFNPALALEARLDLSPSWSLIPEFGITLPKSDEEDQITQFTYWLTGSLGYSIGDYIIQAGLGLHFTRISASGGSLTLNNGASTESFPLPNGSATTSNLTTHLGLRYYFLPDWSAKTQVHFYNPEDSTERAVSLILMVNYHLGDFLARMN